MFEAQNTRKVIVDFIIGSWRIIFKTIWSQTWLYVILHEGGNFGSPIIPSC